MKVGILTSGGDCQSLNAAMRGAAKALFRAIPDVEIYGIQNGYQGLIYGDYRIMKSEDFSGLLTLGGTILGTSRTPFKMITVPDEHGLDKVKAMKARYNKWGLDCLLVLGGNGTQKTANLLSEEGLNVVTLPKTIDNDIWGTDITFGFHSAIDIATRAIDEIHSTAQSHGRIFIVEVMGHKVGWMTLYAGVAGGADIILIPEIPYDINKVAEALENRRKRGKHFSILAVSEGARTKEEAALSKKEYKERVASRAYPTISYELADQLQQMTGQEVRITVPGHTQRGGGPSPYDRAISTQLGAAAAEQIIKGNYGCMIAMINGQTQPVPLGEIASKLKKLPTDHELIKRAKEIGICFGD